MALRDYLIRESGEPTCQDCYQHLEWPLHILILLDTAYYVLLLFFSRIFIRHCKDTHYIEKQQRKYEKLQGIFKAFALTGRLADCYYTQGDCPGLGASALSGRMELTCKNLISLDSKI